MATTHKDTKTIMKKDSQTIDQLTWSKFLIDLDLQISWYHDYSDIILISSPYLIADICQTLENEMKVLNLSYISPLIVEYLFGNENDIESKLNFSTCINMKQLQNLIEKMSIIIIDLNSSQMITIPIYASDLLPTNSSINYSKQSSLYSLYFSMRWSTTETVTCLSFQNVMNDICKEFAKNKNISKYFDIYCGESVHFFVTKVTQSISQIEKREKHIDKKIKICLKNAKAKSKRKDTKGALFELKKKKQLEKQLATLQMKKLNLETQIYSFPPINKISFETMRNSANALRRVVDSNNNVQQQILNLNIFDDSIYESQSTNTPINLNSNEDDELAELEAMMN